MIRAINTGYKINTERFKKIGRETAERHVQLYNWFKIPVSMHRLWFHVPDIVDALHPVTIGQSSEEAIESSHKCIIKALNNHCRQDSYEKMTLDIGHNRLINTDPAVTKYFKSPIVRKEKPKVLPDGIKSLLVGFEVNGNDEIEDSETEHVDNDDDIEFDHLMYISHEVDLEI